MRQNGNYRWILLSLILLTIVAFSGTMTVTGANNSDADVSVSVTAKVSADEIVKTYEVIYIVKNDFYNNRLKAAANNADNSSTKEYLEFTTNSSLREKSYDAPENTTNHRLDVENVETTKASNNGKTIVTVRYEGYKPAKNTSIEVKKLGNNETINYEDGGMSSFGGGNYTLTMPGQIRNASADWIDGDTATWTWNNTNDYTYIQAKSDTSSGFPGLSALRDLVGLILGIGLVAVIGLVLFIWTK